MTDEERQKLDAWVRKMAELDPGLCVSAGGEPYRELIGPRPELQSTTSADHPKVDQDASAEQPTHEPA